jgi:hypothetical protein
MDDLQQKINEQLERLKYLQDKREKNMQILNGRVREIMEKKGKDVLSGNNKN